MGFFGFWLGLVWNCKTEEGKERKKGSWEMKVKAGNKQQTMMFYRQVLSVQCGETYRLLDI